MILNEKTLLPVGMVIAIMGAVGYVSNIHSVASANTADIDLLNRNTRENFIRMIDKQDRLLDQMVSVRERLSSLEERIKQIRR